MSAATRFIPYAPTFLVLISSVAAPSHVDTLHLENIINGSVQFAVTIGFRVISRYWSFYHDLLRYTSCCVLPLYGTQGLFDLGSYYLWRAKTVGGHLHYSYYVTTSIRIRPLKPVGTTIRSMTLHTAANGGSVLLVCMKDCNVLESYISTVGQYILHF